MSVQVSQKREQIQVKSRSPGEELGAGLTLQRGALAGGLWGFLDLTSPGEGSSLRLLFLVTSSFMPPPMAGRDRAWGGGTARRAE